MADFFVTLGNDTPQLPATLGQKTSAASVSVCLASDTSLPLALDNDSGEGVITADTLRVTVATDDDVNVTLTSIDDALAGTLTVQATDLDVRDLSSASDSVTAHQGGTWNVTDISGTVSLPTGAATLAEQQTQTTHLAAIEAAVEGTLVVSSTNLDIRDLTSGSDSVAAVQSGTWNVTNVSGTVSLPTGAATETTLAALNTKVANDYGVASGAVRVAAQIGNAAGIADFGAGAATSATVRAAVAATNIAYTAKGKIAGASLTGTYATLLNPTSDLRVLALINSCDNTILVSLDGGSTDSFELESGESVVLDLAANGMKFDNAVNISAKHNGVAPTSGSIRASGVG